MAGSLTSQIHAYRRGELSRQDLIERVSVYLYTYLHKRFDQERDSASEIFCYLYDRLPTMIDRFVFRGRPFEAYLHITLNRSILSYYRQQKRAFRLQRYSERIYCQDRLYSLPDQRSYPSLALEGRAVDYFAVTKKRIPSPYLSRRLLVLICKSALQATEEQIRLTAELTAVDQGWLEETLKDLKAGMSARTGRHTRLKAMRRSYMAQAAVCREEVADLGSGHPESNEREKLKELNRRIRRINAAIERLPLSPTHGEIARLLSMPKGSVDSCLHYLKSGLDDSYHAPRREKRKKVE